MAERFNMSCSGHRQHALSMKVSSSFLGQHHRRQNAARYEPGDNVGCDLVHAMVHFLGDSAALLLPIVELGQDCADVGIGSLIMRFDCGPALGQIAGRPHLSNKPFAAFAHRKMQTHLEGLPRAQFPIDQGAGAGCNFLTTQHLAVSFLRALHVQDNRSPAALQVRENNSVPAHASPAITSAYRATPERPDVPGAAKPACCPR